MEKLNLEYLEKEFDRLQSASSDGFINSVRKEGFMTFNKAGIPTRKNEEWKYTGINEVFKSEFNISQNGNQPVTKQQVEEIRLPGGEIANELVFVNGKYAPELSTVLSSNEEIVIIPLEEASDGGYRNLVNEHFGKSNLFMKDGIHALNTSFVHGGIFIYVPKGKIVSAPVYFYHIAVATENPILAQPRSLIFVDESAKLQVAENYVTTGSLDSFTNEVMEIVVNTNAIVEYYKIQNDVATASQVGTTHIRQIGKSYAHTVVITLDGDMVRNNTNIIMETAGNEAHMYGLYLLRNKSHVDNHTLVDNTKPNCFSNELYKGIIDDKATGVFSGKIYVRPDAQKTNAYQTNNNILLSDDASVNTKPQLEIFADDVKCSHGCTVGRLDEEALFYLRTRGISKEYAQAMLLHAFAENVIEQIKIETLKNHAEDLIIERLSGETLESRE